MTIESIKLDLQEKLSEQRYLHTEGVAYTAAALAMSYGEPCEDALLAGWLHDCAKFYHNSQQIKLCEEFQLPVKPVEYENPGLLHAKVGAYLAKKYYGITNLNVLNAILYHTTGREGMTLLEKIIFVADYIEPSRNQAPRLLEIRRIAFHELDQAVSMILSDTLQYLHTQQKPIDDATEKTYQFYKKILENKES